MSETWGACLVAYGVRAVEASKRCLDSLLYHYPLDTTVHNSDAWGIDNIQRSRWAKVTLPEWSPYDFTVYLDADTLVRGSLEPGFQMLADGWDMVFTPSTRQGNESMWHLDPDEREQTYLCWGSADILQLQAGVFWFRRSEAVMRLFDYWKQEWLQWLGYDQGALLRAMKYNPVRLYLLGRSFNGGSVVSHYFGEAS